MRAGRTGWKGLGPGAGALTARSQHSPGQRSAGDGVPGIDLSRRFGPQEAPLLLILIILGS